MFGIGVGDSYSIDELSTSADLNHNGPMTIGLSSINLNPTTTVEIRICDVLRALLSIIICIISVIIVTFIGAEPARRRRSRLLP